MTVNDDRHAAREVFPATAANAPTVRAILDDARHWLATRGIAQWTAPFADAWMAEKIAAGEVYIASQAGEPVAVARLLWRDASFWGERERGDAVYLHTLAVRRDMAGRGIGGEMLDWAADQGRRRGRRWLRLDCAATNRGLVAHYLSQGFTPAGEVNIAGETMLLLERGIGRGHSAGSRDETG